MARTPSSECLNCQCLHRSWIFSSTGLCELCGETPPSLQSSRRPPAPRRPQRRSSSAERRRRGGQSRTVRVVRRLSADDTAKSQGLSLDKIERVSFRENYSAGHNTSQEEDGEATQCIICLSGRVLPPPSLPPSLPPISTSDYFRIPDRGDCPAAGLHASLPPAVCGRLALQ